MSSTPEGKVKRKISNLLKTYAPDLWYDMPVPSGFGKSTLDYVCCYYGRFFSIEAKAAGKKPTERQNAMIRQMEAAGGKTFVVSDEESLDTLRQWLETARLSN